MLASMKKNGLLLAAFAAVTTGVVALTHALTKDTIATKVEQQTISLLHELIDKNTINYDIFADCTLISAPDYLGNEAQHKVYRGRWDDKNVALAINTIAPDGYSGSIELLVALHKDGRVAGVRTLAHNETPGLGDKIKLKKSNWITGFEGKALNNGQDKRWGVKKDGGEFDQFTGATITPRAVVKATKKAALFYQARGEELFSLPANCES